MATENKVTLKISTESDGGAGIKSLVTQLEQLAAKGGDAAPELAILATEIKNLDEAKKAAASLGALEQSFTTLSDSVAQAQAKVATLKPALSDASAATTALREVQKTANIEFVAAKREVDSATKALAGLEAKLAVSGTATDKQAEKQRELNTRIEQGNLILKEKSVALEQSNTSLKEAATAEKALSDSIKGAERDITKFNGELTKQEAAFTKASEGARKLGVDVTNLASEEQRLNTAFASTSKNASETAVAVARAAEAQKQAAITAKQVGEATDKAFRVLGVKAALSLEAELAELNSALEIVRVKTGGVGAAWEKAQANFAAGTTRIKNEMAGISPEVDKSTKGIGIFGKTLGGLAAITSVYEVARQFILANVEIQKVQRSMLALTGSQRAAAAEMNFVREAAGMMGVEFGGLAKQYTALLAATKGTSLEGEKTRAVFVATANALTQMGRGSVEAEHAFMALAQMASKGVVSAEELKQQLAEALPGASQAAARGLGLTTAEMDKLVKSGGLLTEDFFPALEKGLNETFTNGAKKVDGLSQSYYRLVNAAKQLSTQVGDSGANSFMTATLDHLTASADNARNKFKLFSDAIEKFNKITAEDADKTLKRAEAQRVLDAAVTASTLNVSLYDRALLLINAQLDKAVARQEAVAAATKKNADATGSAAAKTTEHAAVTREATDAAVAAALAQGDLGAAVAAVEAQTKTSSNAWVSIQNAYNKVTEAAEQEVLQSKKLSEAKKIEGEITVRLAELSGNEANIRNANVAAANANVVALAKVSDANDREVKILQSKLVALQEERTATGSLSKVKEDQLIELQKTIDLKASEAEKSRQITENARFEAEQKRVLTQVYQDNSASVEEYKTAATAAEAQTALLTSALTRNATVIAQQRDAYNLARGAAAAYKERVDAVQLSLNAEKKALEEGKGSKERVQVITLALNQALNEYGAEAEVAEQKQTALNDSENKAIAIEGALEVARRNNAAALALYKDALLDTVAATERKIALVGQENALSNAKVSVDAAELATKEKMLIASGKESEVLAVRIKQKQDEIEILKNNIAAKTQELDLSALAVEQDRVAAEATGTMNAAKKFEIESRLRAIEIKRVELGLSVQQVAQMELEIKGMQALRAETDRKIAKIEQQLTVDQARLRVELEGVKTMEQLARANGNEAEAIKYKVQQKRIEQEIIRIGLVAKGQELDLTIASAQKELQEAQAMGTLTAAKRTEIEARIAAAEAKKIELGIGDQNIQQIELEIQALEKLIETKNNVKDADRTAMGQSSQPGANGRGGDGSSAYSFDYEGMLYKMGATVEEVQAAMQTANAEVQRQMALNPIRATGGNPNAVVSATKSNIELALAEALRKAREGSKQGGVGTSTGSVLKDNPLVSDKPNYGVQPVTINIAGKVVPLNMASRDDVTNLEAVLRQLSEGAARF